MCRDVTNPALEDPIEHLCVSPDDITACKEHGPFEACTRASGDGGQCYDGVCLQGGCGNARLDPGEACDDANSSIGDGCSAECRSDESCGNGIVDPVRIENLLSVPNEACDDGNLVGHDGCDSACRPEIAQWRQLLIGGYPQIVNHAVAYDAARRRLVVFAGTQATSGVSNRIFEYEGGGFEELDTPLAPVARVGHAMAYDAARRRIVLFGGVNLDDTWEWDGINWRRQPAAVSPSPRSAHAMVYDPRRRTVVLFGGRRTDSANLDDTWEWDGTRWTELVSPVRPEARSAHAMVYDPVRGVIVVASGVGGPAGLVQTTWELDAAGWRSVPNAATPRLTSPAAEFDPISRRVIAYGTASIGAASTTWSFDGAIWRDEGAAQPGSRVLARLGLSASGQLVMLGGTSGAFLLDDVWTWTGTTWVSLPRGQAPPALAYRASAADPLTGRLMSFGGVDIAGLAVGSMSTYSGTTWINQPTPVPRRFAAAMAYDAARARFVLFGGFDPTLPTGSHDGRTWTWDGTTWTAAATTGPPGRRLTAMAYDPIRERVVLFGGVVDTNTVRDDTWEWDGQSWTQVQGPHPTARYGHAMVFDPIRRTIILSGGTGTTTPIDETWEWNGVSWTQLLAPLTLARDGHATAWDGHRRRGILFGGASTTAPNVLADASEWSTEWADLPVAFAPQPRAGHSVTAMPGGAGILITAGSPSSIRLGPATPRADGMAGETWALRHTGSSPYEICAGTFDNDGDGLAGCADPDCWVTCTPLCPPGTTCAPNLPRCGDQACAAGIENCRNCPGDCTCPVLCGDFYCDPGETAASCPGDC